MFAHFWVLVAIFCHLRRLRIFADFFNLKRLRIFEFWSPFSRFEAFAYFWVLNRHFFDLKRLRIFQRLLLKNEVDTDDAAQFYDAIIGSLDFGLLRKISIGEFLNFEDLLVRINFDFERLRFWETSILRDFDFERLRFWETSVLRDFRDFGFERF